MFACNYLATTGSYTMDCPALLMGSTGLAFSAASGAAACVQNSCLKCKFSQTSCHNAGAGLPSVQFVQELHFRSTLLKAA